MVGSYEVRLGNAAAGKVQVERRGLYYRFVCCCRYTSEEVYRLIAFSGEERHTIGVPVPEKDGFRLEKKIPVKQFSGDSIQFFLMPARDDVTGKFVPLSPEEPFA